MQNFRYIVYMVVACIIMTISKTGSKTHALPRKKTGLLAKITSELKGLTKKLSFSIPPRYI